MLKNLRHLDVRRTPLSFQTLLKIGDLKSLQIALSKIIIGRQSGNEISKLKEVKCLLQKSLSELELICNDAHDSRNKLLEKEVLNELKPCDDKLIKLKIESYGGLEFPNWVGDPSFLHLKHVSISGCRRCTSLPPLAQLPSLKALYLVGLFGLEAVDFKLTGAGRVFPSLEILSFEDMRGWKKWSGAVFPCLQRLEIRNCPNLVEVTLEALPSLHDLVLKGCDSGVLRRLVEVASAITKLEISISRLNDVAWGAVLEYLDEIEELSIEHCNEIRYLVKSDANAKKSLEKLRKLEVRGCDNLVNIGEKEKEEDNCRSNLLPSLRIIVEALLRVGSTKLPNLTCGTMVRG